MRGHRQGNIGEASPRPWRVEYTPTHRGAVVKAADNAVVCVCHADNAEAIVRSVNDFYWAIESPAVRSENSKDRVPARPAGGEG